MDFQLPKILEITKYPTLETTEAIQNYDLKSQRTKRINLYAVQNYSYNLLCLILYETKFRDILNRQMLNNFCCKFFTFPV
jgi:hypothetical protein